MRTFFEHGRTKRPEISDLFAQLSQTRRGVVMQIGQAGTGDLGNVRDWGELVCEGWEPEARGRREVVLACD
jgi:hypothetical protein